MIEINPQNTNTEIDIVPVNCTYKRHLNVAYLTGIEWFNHNWN